MAAVRGGFPTNQSRPADRLGEALLDLVRVKKSNILRCTLVGRGGETLNLVRLMTHRWSESSHLN